MVEIILLPTEGTSTGFWFLVQRILTGLEDRYERESDLRQRMRLAERCADTFSNLKRNERSKSYYLKQVRSYSFG